MLAVRPFLYWNSCHVYSERLCNKSCGSFTIPISHSIGREIVVLRRGLLCTSTYTACMQPGSYFLATARICALICNYSVHLSCVQLHLLRPLYLYPDLQCPNTLFSDKSGVEAPFDNVLVALFCYLLIALANHIPQSNH